RISGKHAAASDAIDDANTVPPSAAIQVDDCARITLRDLSVVETGHPIAVQLTDCDGVHVDGLIIDGTNAGQSPYEHGLVYRLSSGKQFSIVEIEHVTAKSAQRGGIAFLLVERGGTLANYNVSDNFATFDNQIASSTGIARDNLPAHAATNSAHPPAV